MAIGVVADGMDREPWTYPCQMIEEELEKLRVDDEASSDEDEYAHRLTGLAKEDPEYFGFVG